MPELKSLRQERFAQAYFRTGNASEAYRQAGYTGRIVDVCAHGILVNPCVATRITELKQELALKMPLTKEGAVEDLREMAMNAERGSDRTAAYALIGRWLGWDQPTRIVVSADPLSTYLAELRATPIEARPLEPKLDNGSDDGLNEAHDQTYNGTSVDDQ